MICLLRGAGRWVGGSAVVFLRPAWIALDAAGAFPCVEFFGLELADVGHDGIEDVHLGVDEGELLVDEVGVLGALLDLGVVVGVDFVEGVAVLAEVGDEVRVDGEGEETGAQGGFGGFLLEGVSAVGDGGVVVLQQFQEAVGIRADFLIDTGRNLVEGNGEAEFAIAQLDGAGGAGDAFEVEQQGIDHAGFGDAVGCLVGAGSGGELDAGIDFREVFRHDGDGGVVVVVVFAENEDIFSAGEAAGVAVIHDGRCLDLVE